MGHVKKYEEFCAMNEDDKSQATWNKLAAANQKEDVQAALRIAGQITRAATEEKDKIKLYKAPSTWKSTASSVYYIGDPGFYVLIWIEKSFLSKGLLHYYHSPTKSETVLPLGDTLKQAMKKLGWSGKPSTDAKETLDVEGLMKSAAKKEEGEEK
jgi:hypothetical protein